MARVKVGIASATWVVAQLLAGGLAPAAAQSAATTPAVPDTDISNKNGTLSEKLNQSDGVIHPQGADDPGIQKSAPATGTMPVIPPPGSPGGNMDVQPK